MWKKIIYSIFAGRYCFSKLLTVCLRTDAQPGLFQGRSPIGPKTVHENLLLRDHCFGALGSFSKFLVEEESNSLDLGMFLCNIS